jgi:hypothetical protein
VNVEYRRDMYKSYMIVCGGCEIDRTSYPVHMITENNVPGFLKCRTEAMNGELYFSYDVTSKQSLKTMSDIRPVGKRLLKLLFTSIPDAIETMSCFLLKPEGLLLDPEMIYLDAELHHMWFCYYPGAEVDFRDTLMHLGETLLPKLDHEDREAVVLGYAFYQRCCSGENDISVDFFQNLLRDSEPEDPETIRKKAEEEQKKQEVLVESFFEDENEEKPEKTGKKEKKKGRKTEKSRKGFWSSLIHRSSTKKDNKEKNNKEKNRKKKQEFIEDDNFEETGPENSWDDFSEYPSEDGGQDDWADKSVSRERTKDTGITCEPGRRNNQGRFDTFGRTNNSVDDRSSSFSDEEFTYDAEDDTRLLCETPDYPERTSFEARLVPVDKNSARSEIELTRPSYIVGKSPRTASIVLPSAAVSRVHAELKKSTPEQLASGQEPDTYVQPGNFAGTYILKDLNSKNSTSVNGKILEPGEEYPLKNGDEIRFADLVFRYVVNTFQIHCGKL